MYIPKQFCQNDIDALIETMRQIRLGALVISVQDQLISTQIPFLVKHKGEDVVLEGHVSRANQLWQHAMPGNKSLVIFQGVHAYIHPGWYPTKKIDGRVVPTWNYEAIHCSGSIAYQDSKEWILKHVTELTNEMESGQETPWKVSDAPEEYIQAAAQGIVGLRFKVDKIEGVVKMNQHHSIDNRLGAIDGLSQSPKANDQKVAQIMKKQITN